MMRTIFLPGLLWVSAPVVAFGDPNRPGDSAAKEARESSAGPWKLNAGHRDPDGTTYYALLVADNRMSTGQRHLHLVGRWPLAGGVRFTLDLPAKRGLGEDFQGTPQRIRSGGVSLGYDEQRWFTRLAWDQRQNFGPSDAIRLSIGSRF
jgi:hypothetical protein